MTRSHILPGYINAEGRVVARPVIADIDPQGHVTAHRLLEGHEPPFTTPLNALLRLTDLTLVPIG